MRDRDCLPPEPRSLPVCVSSDQLSVTLTESLAQCFEGGGVSRSVTKARKYSSWSAQANTVD